MKPYCFHGWGFPSEIFAPFGGFDRGYFGPPKEGTPSSLIVTHSFGLHLVPQEVWGNCEELAILSGFIRLKEKVKIRAMKQNILNDPVGLLRAFYQEAGYDGPAPWLENSLNLSLLREDLGQMEEEIDLRPLQHIQKITLYQATKDRIVSKERSAELLEIFPQAKSVEVEGGHMSTLIAWIEQQSSKRPLAG